MARHTNRTRRPGRSRGPCRGPHVFDAGTPVGAGILRLVCQRCGAVSIDLTGADAISATGSLFEPVEGTFGRT